MRIAATLLLLLPALSGDEAGRAVERGFAAFREGNAEAALAELQRAARELGDAAPAELHFDVALAALQAGQPAVAEAAAERAVVRGGEPFVARRAFVRGSASFFEAELATAEALLPDSDPTAFDRAIRSVQAARDAWQSAAASRVDWPQARRNVERALRKLDELTRLKSERQRKKTPAPTNAPADAEANAPPPRPGPERAPEPSDASSRAAAPDVELTPVQIERLFEVLRRTEAEKTALRRARRTARSAADASERDW